MAVGRDVVGADGLTNAERYAKRQADKKARQAAFRAQQDAKKTTASVSSPSSMFGSLLGAVQPTRSSAPTPAPTTAPAPASGPVIRPVFGSATLASSPISSASANEIVNPPELSDYLRNSGTEYGDWLKTIFDAFFEEMYAGPEFDVGDRNRTPDEVAEMKALLDRLNSGESVDLTEIANDYPEFYTYIQSQYDLEGFDGDVSEDSTGSTPSGDYRQNQITDLLSSTIGSIGDNDDDLTEQFNEIEGTYENIVDVLINQAGMSQEEADTLYGLVLQDPTSQAAVTLEGILNREGFSILGGALISPEENNELFAEDTDGDGFVDAVVRADPNADDGYVQVLGTTDALDAEIAAAQEAKENVYNQEGWDDLEPWEQDRALINAGGNAINGTDGTEPEEEVAEEVAEEVEEEVEESVVDDVTSTIEESIDNVTEQFPTWEELWGKIKDSLPNNPQEWGDAIRGILTSAGVNLPSGDIWDILNGGYGVITAGGGSAIPHPAHQAIFIPGIPAGLPSSSTIIGSVEDLITDPAGTLINKVEEVFGDIVSDPGGFVEDLLQGTLEVPDSVWSVLVGGVAAGQDVVDWIKDNVGGDDEEVTDDTVIGGTEVKEEPKKEESGPVQEAENFGSVQEEETKDSFNEETKEEEGGLVEESVDFGSVQEEETREQIVDEVVDEVVDDAVVAEDYRTNQVIGLLGNTLEAVGNLDNGQTPENVPTPEDGLTFGGGSVVFEQQEPAEDYRVNQVTSLLGGMLSSLGGGNEEEQEEQVISGDPINEDSIDDSDDFTFGGVPNDPPAPEEPPPFTVLDPDEPPDPEEPEPLSTDGGGGGGGGGGGSVGGSATDFLENLSYAPFVAPSIIPTVPVNFKNPMDAALDDIISGKPLPRENKNMFTF